MISRKLKKIQVGESVKVISDDPDIKKHITIWSYETGNQIVEFKREGLSYITLVRKGSGFKGESLLETIKFIALGVKLHIIKTLLQIIPFRKIQYLVTFVSVAESLRAQGWLEERELTNYISLPIPNNITKHCEEYENWRRKFKDIKICSQIFKDKLW